MTITTRKIFTTKYDVHEVAAINQSRAVEDLVILCPFPVRVQRLYRTIAIIFVKGEDLLSNVLNWS